MFNYLKKNTKSYLQFLPSYLIATSLALIFDVSAYTLLEPKFGINISAFLTFIGSQIILFTILKLNLKSKITRKRFALPLQICIGSITLLIHIIVLNILSMIVPKVNIFFLQEWVNNEKIYNSTSKIFAACIGFLWTSSMTRKFIFTSNNFK